MALPMYLLYEGTILVGRFMKRLSTRPRRTLVVVGALVAVGALVGGMTVSGGQDGDGADGTDGRSEVSESQDAARVTRFFDVMRLAFTGVLTDAGTFDQRVSEVASGSVPPADLTAALDTSLGRATGTRDLVGSSADLAGLPDARRLYLRSALLYAEALWALRTAVESSEPARAELVLQARRLKLLSNRVYDRGTAVADPRLPVIRGTPDWEREGLRPGAGAEVPPGWGRDLRDFTAEVRPRVAAATDHEPSVARMAVLVDDEATAAFTFASTASGFLRDQHESRARRLALLGEDLWAAAPERQAAGLPRPSPIRLRPHRPRTAAHPRGRRPAGVEVISLPLAAGDPGRRAFEASRGFPLDDFQPGPRRPRRRPVGAGGRAHRVGQDRGGRVRRRKALAEGKKVFYTTPLKALSNQKYTDLVRAHGAGRVGLLTGDNSVNGEAPVVVMTTEVLRNMIYAASPTLEGLRYVVLDEVHYLQNPYRGAVWEEVIIHLAPEVDLVCLSATVSNAEEFADWIETVRGETQAIIEERRPVRLRHLYLVGDREAEEVHLLPTFVEARTGGGRARRRNCGPIPRRPGSTPGPAGGAGRRCGGGRGGGCTRPGASRPSSDSTTRGCCRPSTSSSAGRACDQAVEACLAAGMRLTDPEERAADPGDRRAPPRARCPTPTSSCCGYSSWMAGLEAGFAAHHAGMVPPMKEAVEEAFAAGLVKVGLRHRDPVAGDQHAGPHRRHREAVEVHRRAPRVPHAGGVHPAHRAGGAAGDRRPRLRRRAVEPLRALRPGGVAGLDPLLRPPVVVPADLQHGRQPGAALPVRRRPPPAQPVLRPVRRRQGDRPPRAAPGAQPGAAGQPPPGGALRPGRRRGVPGACSATGPSAARRPRRRGRRASTP